MISGLLNAGIGIAGGLIGGGKRKREMRAAQAEHDRRKAQYEGLDTSNIYANMENTMEDLTVNQQAANFQAQQEQQGLSNIMGQMQGAAGGSGIAALAQSLAGQQSQNLQRASADLGRQERQNQVAERQQAGNLQLYEARGEQMSRAAEKDKVETMFGMAQTDLANKTAEYEAGRSKILKGIGGLASGVLGGFASGAIGKSTKFGEYMSGADNGGQSRF